MEDFSKLMGPGLKAALERLTIYDVAEAAGRELEQAKGQRGLYRSPFPEYHKNGDSNPSFHIHHDGKGFNNYAGTMPRHNKGGVWQFAEECQPKMSKGDIGAWLEEIAGTAHLNDETGQAKPAKKKGKSYRQQEAERREHCRQEREKRWRLPEPAGVTLPIPDFVEEHYFDQLGSDFKTVDRLSQERGWPLEWSEFFLNAKHIARPVLPWAKSSNQRGWAFLCRRPRFDDGKTALQKLGYHQRYEMGDGKQWIFVPYAIREEKAKTDFQKRLLEYRKTAGVAAGASMVEPVPFVIGEFDEPRCVVITEGQWDALTLAGSLGYCDDAAEAFPFAIFGLRGVKNANQFFRYSGRWLDHKIKQRHVKSVWIVADADEAGRTLVHGEEVAGKLPKPSFKDLLKRNFPTLRIAVSETNYKGAKDFNDYYAVAKPSPAAMWGLVEKLELLA